MTSVPPDVDWARVKSVMGEVLDGPPDGRSAELDRLCAGDDALRAAVVSLLDALDGGAEFLAEDESATPAPLTEHRPAPADHIGRYRIVREIGHGGMGTVYEAVQEQPKRTVALKLLHASISSRRIKDRFVREAEVLARLDHPNIARVFDAGTHDDGRRGTPYFALEFIEDALPITSFAEERALSARARVELFLPICDAVHYGHQRGIIHRDLKPGNILVGGDGRPRVIDFGVARVTDVDASLVGTQTDAHEIIGTLRYMSPEQCSGNADEVDVRCDVYALGLVLYETLMGRMPYEFKSTSLLDIPRVIAEASPRSLAPSHGSDLDTIVRKALEKDRDRRYQSVSELANDLRRFLSGAPIEAKRDRTWYVFRKTLQRYRTAVAVVAAFFVLMAAAAAGLGVLYARANRTAESLRRVAYFQTIALAEHALESSRTDELRRLLAECPEDLRGWEWWYLSGRADESAATFDLGAAVAGAVSPDGRLLAVGGRDEVVELWDLASRSRLHRLPIDGAYVEMMSFSDDGRLLAVGTRSTAPSYVFDTTSGDPVLELPPSEEVKAVAVLPDGRRYVTGTSGGALDVRSIETGESLRTFTDAGHWITALATSADGTRIAAGRNDGSLESWSLQTGEREFMHARAHDARVSEVVFDVDGDRLRSSGWDATVKTWDADGAQVDVRLIEADLVRSLALSPDGTRLIVVTPTSIELRDAADGTLQRRLLGQTGAYGAGFRSGSEVDEVVSWSRNTVKIWDLDAPRGASVLGRHTQVADSVAVSPDGRWIASASRFGGVALWNAATGEQESTWQAEVQRIYRLDFDATSSMLAGACNDGAVRVWSVPDGSLLATFDGPRAVRHVRWSDDVVLGASVDGVLTAWSVEDGGARWSIETGQKDLAAVACAPDGRVATGGDSGTVRLWTVDPPELLREIDAHTSPIQDLTWSPDGAVLASGGIDRVVRLWNAADGSLRTELVGHGGMIKGVAFNLDGDRLASSAWEGQIRLWDTTAGTCLLRLRGHVGVVMDLAFSADGERLVSVGNDGTVRLWQAPRE